MVIEDKEILVWWKLVKIARLKDEYYKYVEDPAQFTKELIAAGTSSDLFTFVQRITDRNPKYNFCLEWEPVAVLYVTTYENWWKNQINPKTRNMVRKAQKMGVEVRLVDFTEDFVKSIKEIYDESPLRQGRIFKHYRKDLETLKRGHITFLEQSQFIGAFIKDELIGFVKLVTCDGVAHIMQIMSKLKQRDKSPTNALIAKCVEVCAQQAVPILNYGVWSQRGLGDFKKHHAFERLDVPRYFIPLNRVGSLALKLGLHKDQKEKVPQWLMSRLIDMRTKWLEFKLGKIQL